jgi:hypothetical protein
MKQEGRGKTPPLRHNSVIKCYRFAVSSTQTDPTEGLPFNPGTPLLLQNIKNVTFLMLVNHFSALRLVHF